MPIKQKPGQRGNETYPNNKEEIANVRKNVVKMMHMPNVQKNIANLLQNPQQAVPGLAQLVAMVIAKVVSSIKGKYGSKVHIKMILMLVKLAVSEIALIAKALGLGKMPKQIMAQIATEAGNMLDKILAKQQGQQPQGPQQGPPQGMQPPQGPPQGGMPQQGLLGG